MRIQDQKLVRSSLLRKALNNSFIKRKYSTKSPNIKREKSTGINFDEIPANSKYHEKRYRYLFESSLTKTRIKSIENLQESMLFDKTSPQNGRSVLGQQSPQNYQTNIRSQQATKPEKR